MSTNPFVISVLFFISSYGLHNRQKDGVIFALRTVGAAGKNHRMLRSAKGACHFCIGKKVDCFMEHIAHIKACHKENIRAACNAAGNAFMLRRLKVHRVIQCKGTFHLALAVPIHGGKLRRINGALHLRVYLFERGKAGNLRHFYTEFACKLRAVFDYFYLFGYA